MPSFENLWACIKIKTKSEPKSESESESGDKEKLEDKDSKDSGDSSVELEELQEYEVVNEEEEKIVRCWIPSTEDQIFSLHYGHHGSDVALKWELSIDGVDVDQIVSFVNEDAYNAQFLGVLTGEKSFYPFKFSKTLFVDSAHDTGMKKLGAIELKVSRVVAIPAEILSSDQSSLWSTGLDELRCDTQSENTKRLAEHHVNLADEIQMQHSVYQECDVYPYDAEDPNPHITFRFQYRSQAFLQAQGIMPIPETLLDQNDTAVVKNEESDDDQLQKEIEEAERRLERLRSRRSRRFTPYIKQEPSIKSEAGLVPSIRRENIEIMDLTID